MSTTDLSFINKPYRGKISHWFKVQSDEPDSLGWYVIGVFVDHPRFEGKMGHTSDVIRHWPDVGIIETRNSMYLLVDE